jgi:cysteine-rich repeat protein
MPAAGLVLLSAVGIARVPPARAQAVENGCMEDVAGFGLVCTANDIRIASISEVVTLDDGCQFAGDTVTFRAKAELLLTAQERHDVGIYLATDGGDALTGSCLIDVLPYTPDPPFLDLDGTDDDPNGVIQDTCGDIDDDHNPIFHEIDELTVKCADTNGDGFLDLPNCLSWRQPGANNLCTTPFDAFPGAPSKCNCDVANVIEILVPPGRIVVEKMANPVTVPEPGGLVTFTVVVENTSQATGVTIQTLVDDVHGNLNGQGSCAVPQALAAGQSYTCTFTATVSGNDGYIETDTVTATGVDAHGDPVADDDDAFVLITDVGSAITVLKMANPTSVPEPGGLVTFSVTVTNDSAVDTVTIDALVDSIHGDLDGKGTCAVPQVLVPGASYNCAFTATVNGAPGTSETDVVTASGTDDDDNPLSDDDDATVEITDVSSAIQVIKLATPDTVQEPGGTVTFNIQVLNVSAVDTVTITSLSDTIYGDLNDKGTCAVPQVIPPAGMYQCEFTVDVMGPAGSSETDVVTASGTDDDGNPVSDDDEETVTISDLLSEIQVDKTAVPDMVDEPGAPVTFTVKVTNVSVADTVTITTLDDTIYGDLDGKGTCAVPQVISPGGMYTCQFTESVQGPGGTAETDVVTASGTDDDGNPLSDSDDATVTIRDIPSSIEVTKTANPVIVQAPGGPVDFTVVVVNTSSVNTVTIDTLGDSIHGNVAGQGDCTVPQTLAPAASYTCTFTATVDGPSGTTETDVVMASGTDDDGNPVSDDDDADVQIIECGNGTKEPGEGCDDGNRDFGDGCMPSCNLEVVITPICNHPCPATIRFRRSGLDKFYFRVGIMPPGAFDPGAIPIEVTLLDSQGIIYNATLAAGALEQRGREYLVFRNTSSACDDGPMPCIKQVSMSRRSDGLWRIQYKAYANFATATEAEMTLVVEAGGAVFTKTADWTRLANGRIVNFSRVP